MQNIVIIGGKLQGSEVAYLGYKGGFNIILIDKNPQCPARKLSGNFICADVTNKNPEVENILKSSDMIIPTMENYEVLKYLVDLCHDLRIESKLAFDWEAYKISRSKIRSDKLFHSNGLPAPKYYPGGTYPYIAKPGYDSGSHGVLMIKSKEEMNNFKRNPQIDSDNYIIQEYVTGPSYSVEVIGSPGNYKTYDLTEIFVDSGYDCYSIEIPDNVNEKIQKQIEDLAVEAAGLIKLRGIMDLEVIVREDDIYILEIDARFPSQTPISVYHSSGVNYVKELYDLFIGSGDKIEDYGENKHSKPELGKKYSKLIHYLVTDNRFAPLGEHIMVEGGVLDYTSGITDEAIAITDYTGREDVWRSTFIYSADSKQELIKKSEKIEKDLDYFLLTGRKAM